MIFNCSTQKHGTDTSKDTVTAEALLDGYTAHDANGQLIVGTMSLAEIDALIGSGVLE